MYFVIENEERKMIDQAVIDRINQGDVKAFECLYNDYFVYLCACANSYIFNAEEAQDIVNEVFMKLWYKRGDLFFPIHPLKEMEQADLERQVQTVITSLPDKCRTVFEQYLYSELTPQEIAEKNGISVNTVRVHIKNAMDKMKEKLGSRIGILLFFLF